MTNRPGSHAPPAARQRRAGFSLVELLTTMVLVAILGSLAIPSLTRFLDESARSRAATEFMGGLARARSQAITTGSTVFVCPRASTADNEPACSTGTAPVTDWSEGFYVFNNNEVFNENNIIWEYDPDNSNVSITQFTEGKDTPLATSPLVINSVGTIRSNFVLWRICRRSGPGRQTGSVAVIQRNGGASLEPTESCPTT